jgi:hypothetical protein
MNRQQRRGYLGEIDRLVTKILRADPSWEERWNSFAGCVKGRIEMGRRDGIAAEEISKDIGGALAHRLITAIGPEPIGSMHQALLYFASNAPAHQAASAAWQRAHPDEMLALQRQYPEMGPLQKVEVEPEPKAEREYRLDLHQAAYIVLVGERTPVTRPLIALIGKLTEHYQAGLLVGELERRDLVESHELLQVEVFASWLKGRLRPGDAEIEIAVQDLVKQANRAAPNALQMFYGLAGRWPYRTQSQ